MERNEKMEDLEMELQKMYSDKVGVEFSRFIEQNPDEEEWLYNTYEECMRQEMTAEQQQHMLQLVLESEGLDLFLGKKFGTFKRYGCEGAEGMLVLLQQLL